jgi:hypothetical protein
MSFTQIGDNDWSLVFMNISTNGPHILIFERDQQLGSLINNELQHANYVCYIARTAVEVFDAIARFPIRLVLINLAQAAASRREFWVALDTQRRGSGIQVFTFHCSNLASYGPRDSDDYSQASMADMEIDGTLGLMRLVETVRTRVPNIEATSTTMPRIPRSSSLSSSSRQDIEAMPRSIPLELQGGHHASGSTRSRMTAQSVQPLSTSSAPVMPTPLGISQSYPATSPATQLPAGSQITYSDKIRAVLYPTTPNANTWGSAGNSSRGSSIEPDTIKSYTPQVSPNTATPPSGMSMLQRLANGQMYSSPGLAELSRLVQEYEPHAKENFSGSVRDPWVVDGARTSANMPSLPVEHADGLGLSSLPAERRSVQPNDHLPLPAQADMSVNVSPSLRGRDSQAHSTQYDGALGSSQEKEYQLRVAPIQDLPLQRTAGNQSGTGSGMPMQQQSMHQAPLASITTPIASPSPTSANATPSVLHREGEERSARENERVPLPAESAYQREDTQSRRADRSQMPLLQDVQGKEGDSSAKPAYQREDTQSRRADRSQMPLLQDVQGKEGDSSTEARNAVILDILQSLPAMVTPSGQQEQAMQPQVHVGRATRSLGNVLLDGHLVPQDRLEVAQNIQRMLRGVDMNYQLGEILLMFKLLTPDQLLAASLVGYGLITRTQVSALGRIRQELYAIGLEYDLENLVILFRILTPEQLREARSSVLG